VSGYRTRSFFMDSRHKLSCAVDFSIPGVDNVAIRDYLRTLSDVGVGYYPNSSFVHLDVRDTNSYWVDYAGPGEAPRTNKREHDDEAEGDLRDPEGPKEIGRVSAKRRRSRPRERSARNGDATCSGGAARHNANRPRCDSKRAQVARREPNLRFGADLARCAETAASSIGKRSTLPPERSASVTKQTPHSAAQRTSPSVKAGSASAAVQRTVPSRYRGGSLNRASSVYSSRPNSPTCRTKPGPLTDK